VSCIEERGRREREGHRFGIFASVLHTACIIRAMMEAVHTSETSVYYATTQHNIPEGSNLQIFCSFIIYIVCCMVPGASQEQMKATVPKCSVRK
jgi:hypothetical protein